MLINAKEMLTQAHEQNYAIAHFNINNLEWTKYIIEECETLKTPVIIGVSEGALKYMGGYHTVVGVVLGLINDLKPTIPICLHLDHGSSFTSCKNAIDAGFTSVMIDASKLPLEENIKTTKEVVDYAHAKGITVEAEIGHINSDGTADEDTFAKVEECERLVNLTNVDFLAPALGSVHGIYKKEAALDFIRMEELKNLLNIPLVLHGGTGIPDDKIKEAISHGINKININTELQLAWSTAVRKYLQINDTVYDPRKIIGSGEEAIKAKIREKVILFKNK